MKILIVLLLSMITASAYCQTDQNFMNVKEINISDTAFNQHPVSTQVSVLSFNDTYDSVYVQVDITMMKPPITDSFIISGKSSSSYVLFIPFTQYKATFKNSTISYTYADAILQHLKLKSVH